MSPQVVVRAASTPAPAGPATPATGGTDSDAPVDGAPTPVERASGLDWRFRAGGPIAASPIVSDVGAVYLGTTDGYVYKLGADGRFEWSFNVRGSVTGRLAFDRRGLVYAATAAGRVFALLPGGTSLWVHRGSTSIVSGVAIGRNRQVFFAGADDHVHALSPNGTARWRAPLFSPVTAGPVTTKKGKLAAASAAGEVLFIRGVLGRRRVAAGAAVVEPLVAGPDELVYAVGAEGLLALDSAGSVRWRRPGVRFAPSLHEGGLVVVEAGRIVRLDRAGQELGSTPLEGRPTASPVAAGGRWFVPLGEGVLRILTFDGVTDRELRIGRDSVLGPVADPGRGRVLAATGDGTVASVAVTTD